MNAAEGPELGWQQQDLEPPLKNNKRDCSKYLSMLV